jgi:hypothetical protein
MTVWLDAGRSFMLQPETDGLSMVDLREYIFVLNQNPIFITVV